MKLNQLAGLRGIAAWWVVFYHSLALMQAVLPPWVKQFFSHGYLAVDLFFVLSGFVIFINYYATVDDNFPNNVGRFYWNRLARIYPVHFVMLMGYLALAAAFYFLSKGGVTPAGYTLTTFVQSLFLVQMWVMGDLTWNVPSWSISAEWFVYLFFPIMTFAVARFRHQVLTHLLAALATVVGLHLIYHANGLHSLGSDISHMALLRTMFEFFLGVLVGSLFIHHRALLAQYRHVLLLGFLLLTGLYRYTDLPNHVMMPAAFALLIAYLCMDTSWIKAALSNKALVYLGEISYSTYMVHYLVYDILKAGFVSDLDAVNPLYVGISFLVVLLGSVVLHHVIDVPAQRYFRALAKRPAVNAS